MQCVVAFPQAGRAAEVARRHRSADLVVADDPGADAIDRIFAAGQFEQQVCLCGCREVEAADARAGDAGEAHRDAIAQGRGIVPSLCVLARMREGHGRGARVGADGADGGKDRHVAIGAAAGPAEVGQAEAAQAAVAVLISAAVRPFLRGIGAPLEHPERHVRARKHVDRTGRADEWIDQRGRIVDQARGGHRSAHRHGGPGGSSGPGGPGGHGGLGTDLGARHHGAGARGHGAGGGDRGGDHSGHGRGGYGGERAARGAERRCVGPSAKTRHLVQPFDPGKPELTDLPGGSALSAAHTSLSNGCIADSDVVHLSIARRRC